MAEPTPLHPVALPVQPIVKNQDMTSFWSSDRLRRKPLIYASGFATKVLRPDKN